MGRCASSARGWRALTADAGRRDPRAVIDFPAPDGSRERLRFGHPLAVLRALTLAEVPAVLERAEQMAREGRWLVGLVRFDAAPAFDPVMAVIADQVREGWPLAWFAAFDAPAPAAEAGGAGDASHAPVLRWQPSEDQAQHAAAVRQILASIENGDVYQVNHTIRLRAEWDGTGALALHERLLAAQPNAYAAYLDLGTRRVLSASPELFFERHGGRLRCRPMKGTAPRGRWTAEDDTAAEMLRQSAKDRAENVMIVDLIRNDLGRVAETGSVVTTSLFDVERYPTVLQMTSEIEAQARDDVGLPDLFAALFPCGSVTGAPKIAAMQHIAAFEGATRGAYCGAIGLLRPGGDCTFNVAIRTMVLDAGAGTAEYGTGGGITIDSRAELEHRELLDKAAVLSAPAGPQQLLETMGLRDGTIDRMERHLARLHGSARYFGFSAPTDARSELQSLVAAHPRGAWRVRLLASRNGAVQAEVAPFSHDAGAGSAGEPYPVTLARSPVSSRDVLLFHKTTSRGVYERHRAEHPDAWDVVLWNEREELTELTIGNLVVELDGRRCTPPLNCGLLPGVMRAELLERGEIEERVVHVRDLARAGSLWLVNSLRGWVRVALPG